MTTIKPGDQMSWSHTPRGGYGWVIPVNAEVVKVNAKTVRIRVKRIDGQMVERNVAPESLKPRRVRCKGLDGACNKVAEHDGYCRSCDTDRYQQFDQGAR